MSKQDGGPANLIFTEEQFRERVSGFATDKTLRKAMPRRHKKESDVLCPHCGEPCAPYTTCKEYRELQAIGHILREEIAAGRVEVIGRNGREHIYQKTAIGNTYYAQFAGKVHTRHHGSKE